MRSESIQGVPARAGLASACVKAVLVTLFVESVAELPIVDFHPILVVFGSLGVGPANKLGDPAELVGKESANGRSPGSIAKPFVLDNLQEGRGLPVGRHHGGRSTGGGGDGRRSCGQIFGSLGLWLRFLRDGLAGRSFVLLQVDQAALDESPDMLASTRINPLALESEIRTITRDTVDRTRDIIFCAVELPDPERLDRGRQVGRKGTNVISRTVDEQAQTGYCLSWTGRPDGFDLGIVMKTRVLCR